MKSLPDIQFVPTSDQDIDMLDRLCETGNEFNNVLAAVTFIDCVDQENELALFCKYLQDVLQHRQAWPSSLAGHVAARATSDRSPRLLVTYVTTFELRHTVKTGTM